MSDRPTCTHLTSVVPSAGKYWCQILMKPFFDGSGGGGGGCHLRVVLPGQLHRRPSTPKRFCLSAVFVEPGLCIFCVVSFSCVFYVYFQIVQGFSPRLLCLFSNSFQFKLFEKMFEVYIIVSSSIDLPGL